jgi:hypothetical protein
MANNDIVERIDEWVMWFQNNKKLIPSEDFLKRAEFHDKAIDGAYELIVMLLVEMRKGQQRSTNLVIPSSWNERAMRG